MGKLKFIPIILLFLFVRVSAQNFIWAKSMGSTLADNGQDIAVDATGNVYTTGSFQGTADFDPGAGVFNLTSTGNREIFVSKLDASGNFIWARSLGGTLNDLGYGIAVDASGNVYTTGYFQGTADFDPGAGVSNLTSAGSDDIFVSKLDASGNFVWAKNMGGTLSDIGTAITVDASGNIYTTGLFTGTSDFDPNAGVFNLISGGGSDIFVSKLDASGNFVWAKQMSGTLTDSGNDIAIDVGGNVYTTGSFQGTVDFDPGAGVFNLTSSGSDDIFISKLNASGNFVWAKNMGGTTFDYGFGIRVDIAGNVYSTGTFDGTVDFDPNAGVFNLTSSGGSDIFVSKLDVSGNFVWAKKIGGTITDISYGISLDVVGNVYTTGLFQGTVDFDPGAGVFNLTSAGGSDIFVSKLDAAGNFMSAKMMGGSSSDVGRAINIDALGNLYTTGYFNGTVDFDPGVGVFNLSSVGNDDIFIHKMCQTPATLGVISGSISLCSGSLSNYSVASVPFATSYSWNLPGGWSGSSSNNTISATAGATGVFTVTAINACGTSLQQTLAVTVNPLPTITVNSGSICSGSSFTIIPSGANTYTIQGGSSVVSPTTTNSYTVMGTSTAGCISASSATSNISVSATPTITVNSGSICVGQSFTMVPAGANTYTIQGGSAVVSPTASVSYTIAGTSTAGCVSSSPATSNLTVNPLPIIGASTSNTMLCLGQSATLTASGASTYTFNPGGAGTSIVVSPTVTSTYTISGTSAAGCNNSGTFTQSVSTCAGIKSMILSKEGINIYPNPTNGKVIIEANNEKDITIFNALGSLIFKGKIEEERFEINLEKESNGIYFVKIGMTIKKIVKY